MKTSSDYCHRAIKNTEIEIERCHAVIRGMGKMMTESQASYFQYKLVVLANRLAQQKEKAIAEAEIL